MDDTRGAELAELQEIAKAEAVRQAVALLTTMAMAAGITYLITHRYYAEQATARARKWWDHKRNPGRAREARAVAELRRAISVYEHEQTARPRPGRVRGLYEQGP